MTQKQKTKLMNEAWECHYKHYDMEAEWYGLDDDYIWVCDIPSLNVTVKMELDEDAKRVTIYEAVLEKQYRYDSVRETEWKVRSRYSW